MTKKRIRNMNKALLQPLELLYCESFLCKVRGLSWRKKISKGEGIVLVYQKEGIASSAIHMLGMNFDLAIIWLNKEFVVVDVQLARRWRSFLKAREAAQFVIECQPSRINEFSIGDQIALEDL
jgi:uncharacterized membrane protein (UPF0127 family)